MMIETDPVRDVERAFAVELQRIHRERLGYAGSEVHVHFRDDTIICVTEGHDLPGDSPEERALMESALDDLVVRLLGRRLRAPISIIRHSPDLITSMLRIT